MGSQHPSKGDALLLPAAKLCGISIFQPVELEARDIFLELGKFIARGGERDILATVMFGKSA